MIFEKKLWALHIIFNRGLYTRRIIQILGGAVA